MSKTLYLHIGTHKTATTTLQHFLAKNRKALRAVGLFYPQQNIVGAPRHYAHHRIAHAIAGRDDKLDFDCATAFFAKAMELAGEDDRILISAEPFFRHMIKRKNDPATDPEPALYRYAKKVRAACGDADVRIVVMLRRQDLFIESMYGEHVLSTGYQHEIASFIEERHWMLDYRQRLAVWADVFGADNIMVRTSERESMDTPVEQYFLNWLGVDWCDGFDAAGDQNVALNRTFVEFKRQMNFPNQPSGHNTRLREWLTMAAALPFAADLPNRGKYYLNPKDRYTLMEAQEDGNREVARTYFDRENLFLRRVEQDAKHYPGTDIVTDREIQKITRHLLRMIAQPGVG